MKHEGLTSGAAALGVELSEDQVRHLQKFEELLAGLAVELGMVAMGDRPRLRERHVLDCLRAAAAVTPGDRAAADLGSGAGLPGLVVAIASPGLEVTLVEARRARAAFLELAVERLELPNVAVEHARVEAISASFDLCFARAFADLPGSWRAAEPLLRPGGRLVYFAGASFDLGQSVPEGVGVTILPGPSVASAGPLAIMTRSE